MTRAAELDVASAAYAAAVAAFQLVNADPLASASAKKAAMDAVTAAFKVKQTAEIAYNTARLENIDLSNRLRAITDYVAQLAQLLNANCGGTMGE